MYIRIKALTLEITINELKDNMLMEIEKANIENPRIEEIRNSSDYKLKHMTLLSHIDRLNKWREIIPDLVKLFIPLSYWTWDIVETKATINF